MPRSQFVVEQGEDCQVVQPVIVQSCAAERAFPAEACFLRYPHRRHIVCVRRQPGPLDAAFGERPPGDRAECLPTRTPCLIRRCGLRSRSPPSGPTSRRGTGRWTRRSCRPRSSIIRWTPVPSCRGRCTPSESHPATSPGSDGAPGGNASGSAAAARSPCTSPASPAPYSRRSSWAERMTGDGKRLMDAHRTGPGGGRPGPCPGPAGLRGLTRDRPSAA